MRRRPLVLWIVLAVLATWLLTRPGERPAPAPVPSDATQEREAARPSTGLAAPAAPAGRPEAFPPPPSLEEGRIRLRLVGVGPPGRPSPDVAFRVWTFARGEGGARVRADHEPRRTAANEAWVLLPRSVTLAWVAASADRGRLVAPEGLSVELSPSDPDPRVVRVGLFATADVDVRVVDEESRPVQGARVVDAQEGVRGPPTDALGRTRIRGTAGTLFLHAVATGHASSRQVSVTPAPGGQEETTLALGPGRVVVGRAVDEGGIPLSGVVTGASGEGREQHELAADGSFRFDTLSVSGTSDAPIRLWVGSADGTRSASAAVPGPFRSGEGPVDLGAVRFTSRWPVPVRVASPRGESVTWVAVAPVGRDGTEVEGAARLVTEESGATLWLPDGTYTVRVKPFVVRPPASLAVHGPWTGPPLTVVLEDALVVRGACVHRGGGTPLWAMLMVRARGAKAEEDVAARLDGLGRFSLALPESLHGAPLEIATSYATLVGGLAVPRDGSDLVVDLPPEQALTLVVRAVDASDRPAPFAWARFERVPSRSGLSEGWTLGPSADGEVRFWPVPRGDYRAIVDVWGGPASSSDTFTLDRDGQVVTVNLGR